MATTGPTAAHSALSFVVEEISTAVEEYLRTANGAPASRKFQRKRLGEMQKSYVGWLRQLAKNGGPYLLGKVLNSPAGRVLAQVRVCAKWGRYVPLKKLEAQAGLIDCYSPTDEPVRVEWRLLAFQKPRIISKHGKIRTAKALLLRDALLAMGIESGIEFARRGAGGERALIEAVCDKMEQGYKFWATPDVTDCFPSLRPGHFKELPVKEGLISQVAFLNDDVQVHVKVDAEFEKEVKKHIAKRYPEFVTNVDDISIHDVTRTIVRRGLTLGSVLSPLLARHFLDTSVKLALSGHPVAAGTWVDNLFLGGKSKPIVEAAQGALIAYLQSHPAGKVLLHDTAVRHQSQVHLVGYRFQPGKGHGDRYVHVKPGGPRLDRFRQRLFVSLHYSPEGEELERAKSYWLQWFNSQAGWTKVPVHSKDVSYTRLITYLSEFQSGETADWW